MIRQANMTNMPIEYDRQQVAAEVLELGEVLFDELITAIADRQPAAGAEEAYPVEEVRAAADEFFVALRLLLGMEQEA